ncbi:hypothetical protein Tco_0822551 [Tanacetum coccineum]|uniref:Uncharacterized protein n=1 Tax=Tanacetum coccineum TaxID=301880 RepID=A0ABQ5AI07_9ASTR
MAGPEPITLSNEGTTKQNTTRDIIKGHLSALKELLNEPNNRNLIKPMLLDFDDVQDVSDDEIQGDVKGKAKTSDGDLSKPFKEVLICPLPGGSSNFRLRAIECRNRKSGRMANAGVVQDVPANPRWQGKSVACDKDPTEILKIIRRANETLPHFKERWVSESNAIPNVPELMQISSFMSSHKCPELAKRFSDNIPKTVDEMLKRVDNYLRSEEAFHSFELPRGEF